MRIQKKTIKRKIRRLFFFLIGLFSKTIRKIFYANTFDSIHKSIAVCGRGYSSNKFFLEDYVLYDKVYFSNFTPIDIFALNPSLIAFA